jgi:geranylgeranyl pyrophosphate synthase
VTDTVAAILGPLKRDIEEINRTLAQRYMNGEGHVANILKHILSGGKKIRAALVLLVARMFARPVEPFYDLAAAVELLHAASLVHDDVVDGSPVRRGDTSIHERWSTEIAVLAGDFLFAEAVSILSGLSRPRLLGVATRAISDICAGEIHELLMDRRAFLSRSAYIQNITAKTASLFGAAVRMSGLLAEITNERVASLQAYGSAFGTAFQIMDDVMDIVSDETHMGKPTGSDLAGGVITLPVILHTEQHGMDAHLDAVLNGDRSPEHVQAVLEAIRSSGMIDLAIREAGEYVRRATDALTALPACRERQIMHDLAHGIMVLHD